VKNELRDRGIPWDASGAYQGRPPGPPQLKLVANEPEPAEPASDHVADLELQLRQKDAELQNQRDWYGVKIRDLEEEIGDLILIAWALAPGPHCGH
jgi:hypothetical protein